MDNIIIGFSRPKAFFEPFSWLIRLVMQTEYSHAYIKYYDKYADRWLIGQASGLKVNIVGETYFDSEEVIYAEFQLPITKKKKKELVQFIIDNTGKPYGVGQIFGFAWILFMRMFGKKVANPFASNTSWFCSEFAESAMDQIMDEGDTMQPSTADPRDLYEFIVSKGFKSVK